MNTIDKINLYGINNTNNINTLTSNKANDVSKDLADDTAGILNLSDEAYGDGVVTVKSASTTFSVSYSEIVTAQNNLRTLGFYDGPNSGYVSDDMRQSIRNFQRVYGMATTGSLTENVAAKINEVYSKYTSIYNSTSLNSIASNAQFSLDAIEKRTLH